MKRRRWVTVGAAVGYVLIASGTIWWMTGSDPFTMLLQMVDKRLAGGGTHGSTAYGPVTIAMFWGVPESRGHWSARRSSALSLGWALTWAFRTRRSSLQLAIASTIGYFWTFHRVRMTM